MLAVTILIQIHVVSVVTIRMSGESPASVHFMKWHLFFICYYGNHVLYLHVHSHGHIYIVHWCRGYVCHCIQIVSCYMLACLWECGCVWCVVLGCGIELGERVNDQKLPCLLSKQFVSCLCVFGQGQGTITYTLTDCSVVLVVRDT